MKQILLTGGCGYIGSHTAVELQQNGYDVILADNLSNSKIEVLDGIEKITGKRPLFEKTDFRDKEQTNKLFEKYGGFDGIIHFAAFKAVAESIQKPMMYYDNNMLSSINIINACLKYSQSPKLVFSSSCTVYGIPDKLPVDESMPMREPTSPYGKTKLFTEYMLSDTIKQNPSFKAISLRYFNPIGAHPSLEIGESPLKTYNLIPILTETAIGKRKEILIFGDDYPTADGTPVRDYIHVVDVAKAHVKAMERLLSNKNKTDYEYFNIGVGKGYSVMEIIKTFEKVSGKKIPYRITNRREGDIAEIYASTDLAEKELGWKAMFDLEEMLRTAWLWEVNKKF